MYIKRYTQRDSTPTIDISERRLWFAIIAQALSDAKYRGTTLQELVEKKRAIVWLKKGSIESPKSLLNVCHFAGYDYTYVKEKINKAMEAGIFDFSKEQLNIYNKYINRKPHYKQTRWRISL